MVGQAPCTLGAGHARALTIRETTVHTARGIGALCPAIVAPHVRYGGREGCPVATFKRKESGHEVGRRGLDARA